MAKEEGIEMEGVVTEVLPDRNYRVMLENGHEILAYAAGKMSKFKLRVLEGDRVSVVLFPCYFTLVTFSAAGPFAPCTMSNSTRSPSERLRKPSALMAVWWTKQSLSPFSGVMKPKPFASLNHFTVPRVRAIASTPCLLDCVGAGISGTPSFYERGPVPRHKK